MRLINPSSGGTVGPALAGITSVTSPTGQTLTLATLDGNKDVIVAPHGTGMLVVPQAGILFGVGGTFSIVHGASGLTIGSAGGEGLVYNNITGSILPAQDLRAFGTSTKRWSQGFFGSSGLRIGDGTSGANITTSGTSPNEDLNVTPNGTGRIVTPLGSVTKPIFANSTDPTTGVYYSQSDRVCVSVQGSNVISFYAGGQFPGTDNYHGFGLPSIRYGYAYFGPSGIKIGGTGSPTTTGEVTTAQQITKPVTAIANATATGVLTITVPNAAHSATLRVTLNASLGAGGAVGANEASACISYDISLTRTAGVNAVGTVSTAFGSAASAVAGATTCTVTAALSAVSGAVGASNTFTVNVTISRGGGASTNHTCLVKAEIINSNASGITLA